MPKGQLPPLVRWAASAGSKASVELYIRKGHDINATDGEGRTLLLIAASGGHSDICRLLLDAGADPSLCDSGGHDALSAAVKNGRTETEAALRACLPPPSVTPDDSIQANEQSSINDVVPADASDTLSGVGDENLDLGDWEELTDPPPPQDNPSLLRDARAIQERISSHVLVDFAEDWSDVEIDLPTDAERRNPDHLAWLDAVRALIGFGLSCGWVTLDQVSQVVQDGREQDAADNEVRLRVVLGDVGVPVEDDPDASESISALGPDYHAFGDPSHDSMVEEAVAFLGDLFRNTDHMAHYYRDIKRIEAARVRMYHATPHAQTGSSRRR